MSCCILAAFLLAQCAATLRRWGRFLGLVAPAPDAPNDTLYARVRAYAARPAVRRLVIVAVLVEAGVVTSWLALEHRDHVNEFAARTLAVLRGEPAPGTVICTTKPVAQTRVALARPTE
jgi:hypothetical protein